MANLRLDIPEGAFGSRKNGFPVAPGKPQDSLVVKRIFSDDASFRMPPVYSHKTLTDDQKNTIKRWIEQGAKWNTHWAFTPPRKSSPPATRNVSWSKNDIDRFVLASLEANGLQPAPEADRHTLIRRVTLDLTGIPPTPAEVDAFVRDKSASAYEKVVDRLLASPGYGEQRAHYWLDAARYADTNGLHFDNYREMWAYRDWVIKAFNRNMPFDQFAIEQIAGDLLPNPTLDQKIASGFQRNTVTTDEGGVILPEVEAMYAKDRADTTGTVFMGLTVGCATCHDHKFDPISQKDYYSLTAFFRNTTQPTMDLNVENTPPAIWVPRDSDREQWSQLTAERKTLANELRARRHEALEDISRWLPQAQTAANSFQPHGQQLALEVPSSDNAEALEVAEIGAEAIRLKPGSRLKLDAVPRIEYNRPFTIATWIYVPKDKQDVTLASQIDEIPGAEAAKDSKQKGWRLIIDKGNLGLYDLAPSLFLYGSDGKGISARPSPDYKFKPGSWYHLLVTYNGSGVRRGLQMYVDGSPVFVLGRPEDIPQLQTSIACTSPISIGDSKAQKTSIAIADLRILDGAADPQEAELLYKASRIRQAARKSKEDLSQADSDALAAMYLQMIDKSSALLVRQLHDVDRSLEEIRTRSSTALVMRERTDAEPIAHVLYRGQYDQMREEVHANTPSVLPPMAASMPRNRLGLAMWIADPGNPLTARVTINRFWQEIFGTGLVRTAEDFGSQGEPPSHPELLDYLAVDFRDSNWDVKRLFKMIVMSATYRQSAETTPEKIAKDPQNRLLAHGPRFRMDAEMVRDYALSVSGLLRPQIGGPSVKPYQPLRIWETVAMDQSNTRVYQQDTGENLYRRSLYTFWKRAAPPASMDIFNAPSRETCIVRRERTNTPLQALVTMNDVQFVQAARVLAEKALKTNRHVDAELNFMAARVLARPLEKREQAVFSDAYRDFLDHYSFHQDDASKLIHVGETRADRKLSAPKLAALTMVANTMLNLDETLAK